MSPAGRDVATSSDGLGRMPKNILHDVAIVGIGNTRQAKRLPGETATSLATAAAVAALEDAGLTARDVDGVGPPTVVSPFVYEMGLGPVWEGGDRGVLLVLEAAAAIATGQCNVVLIADGNAGQHTDRNSTAPWTRPSNEFVESWGMFTPAHFALVARRHVEVFGTTAEQIASVAATIRNNGHVNPEAVFFDKGPFTPEDVLASRMIADPLHLLDCAMSSEGGSALILTSIERARDLRQRPVRILGGGHDSFGPPYQYPPSFDLRGAADPDTCNGYVGRRAADRAFTMAGLNREDVDVLELYDAVSFEIIRQLEAYRFCPEGEGGLLVSDGAIDIDGKFPVTTDGGLMSFSHPGSGAQSYQRINRSVMQLRGQCPTRQRPGAEVAMCSVAGAGAMRTSVLLLAGDSR